MDTIQCSPLPDDVLKIIANKCGHNERQILRKDIYPFLTIFLPIFTHFCTILPPGLLGSIFKFTTFWRDLAVKLAVFGGIILCKKGKKYFEILK